MIAGDFGQYEPSYETLPSLWENSECRYPNPGKITGMGKIMVDIYTPPGSKEWNDPVAWP